MFRDAFAHWDRYVVRVLGCILFDDFIRRILHISDLHFKALTALNVLLAIGIWNASISKCSFTILL